MDEILDDISDKIFLSKLKKEFVQSINESIKNLKEYSESGNYKGMRRIAHDIKGVAGIFGYEKGTELALKLQKAIDTNNKKMIDENNTELIEYMKKIVIKSESEE